MSIKHLVGTAIQDLMESMITRNYRSVPFIPNGRIMALDLKRALVDPRIIFDVGGNEGQTAIYYARHFKNATIFTFEPVKSAYQEMVKHTNDPRIKCFNQGMGNEIGEATIYKSDDYTGVSSIKGASNHHLPNKETVQITTGEAICNEYHIAQIDLLKIDTEGFEINVLDGFKAILSTGVKFIYIEASFDINNSCQTYISVLLDHLRPHGFIVSGLYGMHRKGFGKLALDHCDILLTNTNLVKVL